jgi:hypothetical protein
MTISGQVLSDGATENASNRLNEKLSYGYDPAGNLAYRTNNALVANFQVNNLIKVKGVKPYICPIS